MSRQQERRLSQRTRIDRLTYIELPSGNGGIVKDVSESGLGFYAVAPLEGANAVPISIRVSLRGAVKRIHATGDLAWTDGSRKCGGLRFTQLPDESVAQIRSWQFESSARPEANGEARALRPLAAMPKLQPAPQPVGELALQNAAARAEAAVPSFGPVVVTSEPLPGAARALPLQRAAASISKAGRGLVQRFRLPRVPRLRRLPRLPQLPHLLQISRLPSLNTIAFAATFAGRRGPSPLMVAAISVLAGAIGFMSNGWYREMRGDFSSTVASAREASDVVPQVLASSRPAVAAPASAAATNRMFEVAQASAPAPAAAGPVDIGFGADDSKPANLKPTTAALNPKVALASAAGDFIFVEVGAYPRQTEAQGLVEKLRLHNFFAYASGPAKDALYRVQLGPYTTEEAASLAQSALEKAGFSAFVHTASESQ